jgi:GTP-binding protein
LFDRIVDLYRRAPDATAEEELRWPSSAARMWASSLVNALLGERTLVSQTPGTTRDAVDALFRWHDRSFRLVDTAGMLKKPEAHGAIEYYAALRSLAAIARCDIALLVFDAMTGIMAQDRRLAGIAIEGTGLIVRSDPTFGNNAGSAPPGDRRLRRFLRLPRRF